VKVLSTKAWWLLALALLGYVVLTAAGLAYAIRDLGAQFGRVARLRVAHDPAS